MVTAKILAQTVYKEQNKKQNRIVTENLWAVRTTTLPTTRHHIKRLHDVKAIPHQRGYAARFAPVLPASSKLSVSCSSGGRRTMSAHGICSDTDLLALVIFFCPKTNPYGQLSQRNVLYRKIHKRLPPYSTIFACF